MKLGVAWTVDRDGSIHCMLHIPRRNARRPVAVVARFEVAASFDSQEWPDVPGEVWCPLGTCAGALKSAVATFKKPTDDPAALVEELVDYANRARRDGILALEKVAEGAKDAFLRKALMMAVDGADATTLRETMEVSMHHEEDHGEDEAKVFEAAGGYCPTIEIIGAVLGLIHVMSNLRGLQRARTRLRLTLELRVDEEPENAISASSLVDLEPRAAAGFNLRHVRRSASSSRSTPAASATPRPARSSAASGASRRA